MKNLEQILLVATLVITILTLGVLVFKMMKKKEGYIVLGDELKKLYKELDRLSEASVLEVNAGEKILEVRKKIRDEIKKKINQLRVEINVLSESMIIGAEDRIREKRNKISELEKML